MTTKADTNAALRPVPGERSLARFNRLCDIDRGAAFRDWSSFCTVGDHCTGPCVDCGSEARRERDRQDGLR